MIKMKLIVREFEDYREYFPLWSTIYIQIGEFCYPFENWTDATSAVLEMWIEGLTRMMDASYSEIFSFMDGPYALKLNKQNDSVARATIITSHGEVLIENLIDLVYFQNQLLSATEIMVRHYQGHEAAPQIQKVLRATKHLREAIQKNQ